MFFMVIMFTVIAQWLIVEYGGDFTQTYPLNWEEWKYTVALGAGSLPVGFVMRWIPVTESVALTSGIDRIVELETTITPIDSLEVLRFLRASCFA
jgi:hypothetical protein